MSNYFEEEFDPYEAAQDYYEKFQRGTLTRRGGNMDWINTSDPRLQRIFIEELQRLFGNKYIIRVVGCYFSVEEATKTVKNHEQHENIHEEDDNER